MPTFNCPECQARFEPPQEELSEGFVYCPACGCRITTGTSGGDVSFPERKKDETVLNLNEVVEQVRRMEQQKKKPPEK